MWLVVKYQLTRLFHVLLTTDLTWNGKVKGICKNQSETGSKELHCQDHMFLLLQCFTNHKIVITTRVCHFSDKFPKPRYERNPFNQMGFQLTTSHQALRPMLMALEAAEHRAFKACQMAEEVPCLVMSCCFWSQNIVKENNDFSSSAPQQS